jgi:threonine dehydrogenase-like Zn-dependent dehydrogenase
MIEELGAGLEQVYAVGQQVIVGATTPRGQCFYCLNGTHSRCDGALGGWRIGKTIEGAPPEYLVIPDARANLAVIPEGPTDDDVLLGSDIFSTSFSAAKSTNIKSGDSVAIVTLGPIGLCATVSATLQGASFVIGIDSIPERLEAAKRLGADVTLNIKAGDPVPEIKRLTGGLGVDVAIDALGQQETFERALRATRPGGTLTSVGQYSGNVMPPGDASYAGERIVTRLCPGGKARMRRLMAMVEHHRVDLFPLVTHSFALDDIEDSYDVFSIRTWRVGQWPLPNPRKLRSAP